MGVPTVLFKQGKHLRAEFLVGPDGRAPARDFLAHYADVDAPRHRHMQRIRASIDLLIDSNPGIRLNPQMFKIVEGTEGIYEFKAHQLRLFCFFSRGGRLLLEFGVVKKKDKHDRRDIERAKRMRDDFVRNELETEHE